MPWVAIGPYDKYETFVDDEDVHILEDRYWLFDGRYVKHKKNGKRNGPDKPRDPSKVFYLHREIMGNPSTFVDHIDRNPLNNARSNLRVCSQHENNMNRLGGTVFRRLHRPYSNLPWGANVVHNYKSINVGAFATKEEAIEAYKAKKKELCGEFAPKEYK